MGWGEGAYTSTLYFHVTVSMSKIQTRQVASKDGLLSTTALVRTCCGLREYTNDQGSQTLGSTVSFQGPTESGNQ